LDLQCKLKKQGAFKVHKEVNFLWDIFASSSRTNKNFFYDYPEWKMKHLPKVLLIDDEVDYLNLLTPILRRRGFDVYSLSNGEDVLTVTRKFMPDIILLDVRLGRFDGRLLCWQIKTDKGIRGAKIILHSAFPDVESSYKTYCADEFILKPTEADYIIARFKFHLG